jgi:hypothetical protein
MKKPQSAFRPALIALTFLLQACPAPVFKSNTLPPSFVLAQPASIFASGEYVHKPSGFAFPATVDIFQRVELTRYDSAGLDVSAGYNSASTGCPIRLTIYVSPAPRVSYLGADPALVKAMEARWLDSAYQQWKRAIADSHVRAKLIGEAESAQDGVPGKKAVYAVDGEQSEVSVHVAEHAWLLTYRISFPSACEAIAHGNLDVFFSRWHGASS